MIKKINAIRKAIECECYLPALALALTLPDICGQIEHPEYVKNNGDRKIGKQYMAWFDEWVNHLYANTEGWIDDFKQAKKPYFTGKMCYDLRCSFLHSGNSEIRDFGEKESEECKYDYSFSLSINGCDSFGEIWEEPQRERIKKLKVKTVRIDVIKLCLNLCDSAERYYNQNPNKDFSEHNIEIVDIKKITDEMCDINKKNN